jgi:hypothetical protein
MDELLMSWEENYTKKYNGSHHNAPQWQKNPKILNTKLTENYKSFFCGCFCFPYRPNFLVYFSRIKVNFGKKSEKKCWIKFVTNQLNEVHSLKRSINYNI